jgi:hypothetical protein
MKLTFLKIYLLPLTVLIILGIIVVANKPLASTTQSKQQISVLNKTQTLRVVNAEIVNEDFRLTMRNNSAKSITNFEIGVGNGVTYQTEFLYADVDKAVLPGRNTNKLIQKNKV